MAKRNRYRALEDLMTKVILGDVAFFIAFLIFSGSALSVLKVICAIVSIVGSTLALAWLFLTGELTRRRSLWMVSGFAGILLLVIISLILGYPCPKPV